MTPSDYMGQPVFAAGSTATRFRQRNSSSVIPPSDSLGSPGRIEQRYLLDSLGRYGSNGFVQFLEKLFPNDNGAVCDAVAEYFVGTGDAGETIFWQVDSHMRVRTGKAILYDNETGKRSKDRHPDWVHSQLRRRGELNADFNLEQCFFGEHLLSRNPDNPIAIVESEKTAIIASICEGVFPDVTWLASGGVSNLNATALARIARGRTTLLYPDAGCLDRWTQIARKATESGCQVAVSSLIEGAASDSEREQGFDLADYLIREQRLRNDPDRREWFSDEVEERLSIMVFEGCVTLEAGEDYIELNGWLQDLEQRILLFPRCANQ